MSETPPMSSPVSSLRIRAGAILSTNLLSMRGVIRRLRGQRDLWPDVVKRADLPEGVAGPIVDIVRRTGLWNSERIDVARELCNHAAEALDAGREVDEVAASFGDPRTVAKLIRRSTKRKRPLPWQIRAWTLRVLAGTAGLALLAGGGMTARFFAGSPTIKRNFIAELNAPIEALDEDQKSWLLLREAWATLAPKDQIAHDAMRERADAYQFDFGGTDGFIESHAQTGIDLLPVIPGDHPDAGAARAVYATLQDELALLKIAALRPRIGMPLSTRYTEMPEELYNTPEARGWLPEPIPLGDDPEDQDWVVSALLPALGPTRIASKWLGYDAMVKISEGNADGAIDSVEAMLGFASQAEHDGFLIGYLVGAATEHLALRVVSEMITEHGPAIDNTHLVRLAHLISAPRLEKLPLAGEQLAFQDFLQRSFTDDGNGDGHFTYEGVKLWGWVDNYGNSLDHNRDVVYALENMKNFALIASRAEQQRMADKVYAELRNEEAQGYGIYRDVPLAADAIVNELDKHRYRPLRYLLPALGKVTVRKQERRARIEATLVGIAAELYRREHGAWPTEVEHLAPRYLPFVPEDPVTGDPIAIAAGERSIIVYALGPDQDDDGGTMNPVDEPAMRPRARTAHIERPSGRVLIAPLANIGTDTKDGDWVLFPHTTQR